MKIAICVCISLAVLFVTHGASAGDKNKDNKKAGKSAQPAAGNQGKAGGQQANQAVAHRSRSVDASAQQGTQHAVHGNKLRDSGQGGDSEHGVNAQQNGEHGLNAHHLKGNDANQVAKGTDAEHGVNAHQNAEHGLNAHHFKENDTNQAAKGGLNAQSSTQHGLKANTGATQQQKMKGQFSGNRALQSNFAKGQHFERHWRSNVHWRNYHDVYAGYHRVWHDRGWWGAHYNRVVFIGGGPWNNYWYWDGGYWFPAWGYDPVYVNYVYDGPIYAYDNLPPDQVVVNIQEALQDQGYYTGEIDGQLGQLTRDAIAAYQRDHNLELTAAIDEATVQSLGLTSEEET
jgi:hypothetical protein